MLYPLKFNPILKDKIWGGTKLQKLFNKQSSSACVGESWELSGYEGDESVVSNGFLAGNTLPELIEVYMGELVGDKIFNKFGLAFPLLLKLIDANDDLSIQVHPDDEVAAMRHNSFGKTEMWYVVDAEPDAQLIIGFPEDSSKEEYVEALEKGKVEDILQKVNVKKGDVFFIPAGLVHAIGKGVIVAEIQESSDITYRIYDYNRKDEKGNERELHIEQALDVIDFRAAKEPKIKYDNLENKVVNLTTNEFFTTNIIRFNQKLERNYAELDSFVAYMCMEGKAHVQYNNEEIAIIEGDTILIPAVLDQIILQPEKECTLLEVYIDEQE